MKTIGFIGVGELALYTIKGVRRGGYQDPILLSPRNQEKAEYLAAHHHCKVMQDNQSVVNNSDYIVIATRPAHCLETLANLEFRPDQFGFDIFSHCLRRNWRSPQKKATPKKDRRKRILL